jgi:adenosylhomocysteine nucleosidase
MRTVLVIAAEPWELEWIRPGRNGLRFRKAANGPGPERAAAAVDIQPDAVLSCGVCGALDPDLRIGDIVVGASVNGEPVDLPKLPGTGYRLGGILSVDRVVGTAAEKRSLGSEGAIAVEMEAAGLLAEARRRGVPLYCIRAVSDCADETFEVDLNAARVETGFSVARILSQAARRPFAIVPELIRLRRNAKLAARRLGDFVASCDF